MTFKATVNAEMFRRCALAQSSEATRYYLRGVKLERHPSGEGVLMIATDGHILACFYDRDGTIEGEAIVALPKHVMAACKGSAHSLTLDGDTAEIFDKRGAAQFAKGVVVDGTFPDWRRIIPKPGPDAGCAGQFDHVLLSRLGAILSDGKLEVLSISGDGASDPHIVRGTNPNGFGVAMPLRLQVHAPKGVPFTY